MRFSNFMDKKKNKARKELKIVGKLLERGEFKVDLFTDEDDPYIYVRNNENGLSFDGVRVYKVGNDMAYRVQKESKTEPYGAAYGLNLEEIFGELITDMSSDEAAKNIERALVEEFKSFFKKSSEAQNELNGVQFDKANSVIIGGRHGDLSNSM